MQQYQQILQSIKNDERYQRNVAWGKPRSGHPEGSVRAHIADLERNLDRLRSRLSEEEADKLRLLIHTHDTFKPESIENAPIEHPQSHASLAAAYLAQYLNEADLIAMVQRHDEPFALWRQMQSKGRYDERRFDALLGAIHDWDLFLAFLIIDGCTAGKSRQPLQWFFQEIDGKVATRWTAADLL